MRRTQSPTAADLRPYLKCLNSRNAKRREEALTAVREFSDDQLLLLAAVAAQQIEGGRRRLRTFNPIVWIMLIMPAVAQLILYLHRFLPIDVDRAGGVLIGIAVGIPCAVMFAGTFMEPTRLYMALREVIATRQSLCLLGPALDLHMWESICLNPPRNMPGSVLLPAIGRMARQMKASDYADLTARQRETLLCILKIDVDHSLAILEGLKTVSDKRAMDRVEKLIAEPAITGRQRQLRGAARQCLIAMQREQAAEKQANILLRGSDANTVATSEILLRPTVTDSVETPSDHLLRAVAASEPEPHVPTAVNVTTAPEQPLGITLSNAQS